MLIRLRWFMIGVVATVATGAYIVNRVRQMREKLAPKSVARAGVHGVADLLDAAAKRIEPSPTP